MDRLPADTCEYCKYWNRPEGHRTGECRFDPPVQLTFGEGVDQFYQSCFPITHAGEWCGKHERVLIYSDLRATGFVTEAELLDAGYSVDATWGLNR